MSDNQKKILDAYEKETLLLDMSVWNTCGIQTYQWYSIKKEKTAIDNIVKKIKTYLKNEKVFDFSINVNDISINDGVYEKNTDFQKVFDFMYSRI